LNNLNLRGTNITGVGLSALRDLPIGNLYLGNAQVDDEGLKSIGLLAKLRSIELDRTQITDAGIEYLEGLRESLRSLSLCHTNLTDEAIVHLEKLTNLGGIDLFGTQLTEEGVKRLQHALPDCFINLYQETEPFDPMWGTF